MNETRQEEGFQITENDLPQEFILKVLGQSEARGLWGIKNTREPVDALVRYAKNHELSLPIVQMVITREGIFVSPLVCKLENQVESLKKKMAAGRENPSERSSRINDRPPMPKRFGPDKCVKVEPKHARGREEVKTAGMFHFCPAKRKPETDAERATTDLQLLEKFSRLDWKKSGIQFFGIDTISYGVQDLIFTRVFSMIVVLDRVKKKSSGASTPFACHAFVCESRSTARKVTYALAAAFQAYGRSIKLLRGKDPPKKSYGYEERPKMITIELKPFSEIAVNDSEA